MTGKACLRPFLFMATGATVLLGAVSVGAAQDLVTIQVPERSPSPLEIGVTYRSDLISLDQLGLTAEVAGKSAAVSRYQTIIGGPVLYHIVVPLDGVSRGSHLVQVRWNDLNGQAMTLSKTFFHDELPQFSFSPAATDPEPFLLHDEGSYRCSCADDGPAGCLMLTATVGSSTAGGPIVGGQCYFGGGATVDVPMDAFEGRILSVSCAAVDDGNQPSSARRSVWVDRRNRVRREAPTPAAQIARDLSGRPILGDVGPDATQIAYEEDVGAERRFYLVDVASGLTTFVVSAAVDNSELTFGGITAAGLWVVLHNGLSSPGSQAIYLYANDTLTLVEPQALGFTAGRNHLAWLSGGTSSLLIRDLRTNTDQAIAVTMEDRAALEVLFHDGTLSDDGRFAYYDRAGSSIVVYGPAGRQAFHHGEFPPNEFEIDGDGIVCHDDSGHLHRLSPAGDVELAGPGTVPLAEYSPAFRLRNGWLIYGKPNSGGSDLWLRAPGAVAALVPNSQTSGPGKIVDLGADGQVLFGGSEGAFWHRPGKATIEVDVSSGDFLLGDADEIYRRDYLAGRFVVRWPAGATDERLPALLTLAEGAPCISSAGGAGGGPAGVGAGGAAGSAAVDPGPKASGGGGGCAVAATPAPRSNQAGAIVALSSIVLALGRRRRKTRG